MTHPCLIGVDWGTTACRAYLIGDGGRVLAQSVGPGILGVQDQAFADALRAMTGGWRHAHGPLPVLLSGMVGSRQGWVEAPYLACPASARELAAALVRIEAPSLGPTALVPGLTVMHGDMPDVMRGEETQVIGALAGAAEGLFVLPGTHSKWVEVAGGRITGFRTFMTGEVYGALKDHTILGRLMQDAVAPDRAAFARGVAEGAAQASGGALLHRLFAARTYGLFERLPAAGLADYLSGLLIGAEIAEATRGPAAPVTVLASPALAERYLAACAALGRTAGPGPPDCAAAGHYRLAQAAGLVWPER